MGHPAESPVPGWLQGRAVLFALLLLVPLAVSTSLTNRFTGPKWFTLEGLAILWFLVELWTGRPRWPQLLREPRFAVAAGLLAGIVLWGALREGLAWAGPVLLDRVAFLMLALAAFWRFRGEGLPLGTMIAATRLALSATVLVGLAQVLGWQPLQLLATAGDARSAFFGNANLAAQSVGFALVLLLALAPRGTRAAVDDALLVAGLVYVFFLSSRSVILGLCAAFAALVAVRAVSARRLAALLLAAAVAIGAVLALAHAGIVDPFAPRLAQQKAESTDWRLAVLGATLEMIADHPFGVGPGRFVDAFLPYALGLFTVPREAVVFETPHDEFLRVAAEHGLAGAALAAVILVWLIRRSWARGARAASPERAFLAAGGAFLVVEAAFQFPLATPCGCLAGALLLGLALACAEAGAPPEPAPRRLRHWQLAGSALVLLALVGLARVLASDWLYAQRRGDSSAQERACAYDPRNLPACVTAAWLEARAGAVCEGRATLLEVLRRTPHYYPAIRLLADEAEDRGDREEACLALWVYDELLRGSSSLHRRRLATCGRQPPAGLPAGFTVPHYAAFPATVPCRERTELR